MHYLPSGMDACIGSTGGNRVHRADGVQLTDGFVQCGLHTVALALPLPATKSRTLVLQAEGNPSN